MPNYPALMPNYAALLTYLPLHSQRK